MSQAVKALSCGIEDPGEVQTAITSCRQALRLCFIWVSRHDLVENRLLQHFRGFLGNEGMWQP
eukprot:12928506-Prorocentrum_lima.AAC.1